MDGFNVILQTHMKNAHSPGPSHECEFCKKIFSSSKELRTHILNNHKNYKPCKNFFEQNGVCRYDKSCHFSHVKVPDNKQRCYRCGFEFDAVGDLMKHRKSVHMEKCR